MKPLKVIILLCALSVSAVIPAHADNIADLKKTVTDKSYKNYWDRLRAIDKLGETGNKESTVILADLLDDDEPPIREAAVMALGNLSDAEAIEYLASTPLFHPKSSRCRWHCAWALGLIKNDKALPQLLKALNDPDETVQVKTLQAIGVLPNGATASETLIKKLNDGNPYVRDAAASALGALKYQPALPHLLKKVNDSQWPVKAAVLEAVTAIDPKSALAYVTAGLKNSALEIRIVSLELLPRLAADKTAVSPALMRDKPTLIKYASELLVDKNDAVRASAVLVLRQMRDKNCVAPLIQQLNRARWRLRYDIITALKDLTGAPLGYKATSWTGWFEANKD
ncbi:MAG: HEAT repeat domain-containing protein, partial [Planctomycetes bacterium]|nr:HEAT repeat domain-containing protein [Planctomycetota bacterium]